MYLPDVDFFVPKEPPAYTDKDMWIGNELVINKHRFRLIGADEYALRYMELNAEQVSLNSQFNLLQFIKSYVLSFRNALYVN